MNILYALTILAILQVSNAHLGVDSVAYKDFKRRIHLDNPAQGNYTVHNYTTKLDHFSPWNNRTFKLKYYNNSLYFKNDTGPIFLYICGESACNPPKNSSSPVQLAIKLKAKLMALEHRYYGDSQPFNNSEGGWSIENMKYLTSKQAIEDIHGFIKSLRKTYGQDR